MAIYARTMNNGANHYYRVTRSVGGYRMETSYPKTPKGFLLALAKDRQLKKLQNEARKVSRGIMP